MSKAKNIGAADKVLVLREQIARLKAEDRSLREQTRSPREVERFISSQVDAWCEEAKAKARRDLMLVARGGHANFARADVDDATGTSGAEARLGPMLALMLGAEVLKVRLLAELDAVPECPDTVQRMARIEEIGRELFALEVEEEALICQAEDMGETIFRRGDARPEIVLGSFERLTHVHDPDLYLVTEVMGS